MQSRNRRQTSFARNPLTRQSNSEKVDIANIIMTNLVPINGPTRGSLSSRGPRFSSRQSEHKRCEEGDGNGESGQLHGRQSDRMVQWVECLKNGHGLKYFLLHLCSSRRRCGGCARPHTARLDQQCVDEINNRKIPREPDGTVQLGDWESEPRNTCARRSRNQPIGIRQGVDFCVSSSERDAR